MPEACAIPHCPHAGVSNCRVDHDLRTGALLRNPMRLRICVTHERELAKGGEARLKELLEQANQAPVLPSAEPAPEVVIAAQDCNELPGTAQESAEVLTTVQQPPVPAKPPHCVAEGCELPVYARGLCNHHWAQAHTAGTLDQVGLPPKTTGKRRIEVKAAPPPAAIKPCLAGGCDRAAHARGLCKMHYNRAYFKHDLPEPPLEAPPREDLELRVLRNKAGLYDALRTALAKPLGLAEDAGPDAILDAVGELKRGSQTAIEMSKASTEAALSQLTGLRSRIADLEVELAMARIGQSTSPLVDDIGRLWEWWERVTDVEPELSTETARDLLIGLRRDREVQARPCLTRAELGRRLAAHDACLALCDDETLSGLPTCLRDETRKVLLQTYQRILWEGCDA